jgi:hypothetical protein
MNTPEEKDPLDALLREQNSYIDDGGFTARVVQSLPHRRCAWLRPVLLLSVTVIGSGLAFLWVPWGSLPALDWSALLSPNPQVLLPWALALTVVGSLIWSAVAAVQWED